MLDKTKAAIMAEITESTIPTDPAPMPFSGTAKVLNALKEDVVEIVNKHKNDK